MTVRIGLLLDRLELRAWEQRAIERSLAQGAELVCIIIPETPSPQLPFLRKLWERRRTLGYSMFDRLDRRFFRGERDPFEVVPRPSILDEVPVVEVAVRRTGFRDYVEDVEGVRRHTPTVLIRFGFRILVGAILDVAPAGVWSFHHADSQVNRGGPPGFWEVDQQWARTGSTLQVLSDQLDGGLILDRCWSLTDPVSPTRNRARYYWRALGMLPRAIGRLAVVGSEEFLNEVRARGNPLPVYSRPLYRAPSNREAISACARLLIRGASRRLAPRIGPEQWGLAFAIGGGHQFEFRRFSLRRPPAGVWWADPSVVHRSGAWWVFHEELLPGRPGRISVQKVDEAGNWSSPMPVLERPYHLSYPFVFEHAGELFMVPECSEARRVEFYRSVTFPEEWEKVSEFFIGERVLDPTVLQYDGRWWMFCGWQEEEGAPTTDQLRLFMSDDPVAGPWVPHPANPIVNDVRGARPAGPLFEVDGRLIRPGQDSSGRYGRGIVFHEITELTAYRYSEAPLTRVLPEWDKRLNGIHCFASNSGLTVVDVLFRGRLDRALPFPRKFSDP